MRLTVREPRLRSRLFRLGACLSGDFDSGTDWLDIVAIANHYLVGPDLHRSLLRSGRAQLVDPEALDYLEQLDTANGERNRSLCREAAEVAAALQAEGVQPLLLKGAALLVKTRDPGDVARMIGDIDILVAPEEVGTAVAALGELGYALAAGTARGHSPGNYWKPNRAGVIDLHASLPHRMAHMVSSDELLARSLSTVRHGIPLRVPDPSLQLLMAIAHEMIHDQAVYSGATELRYLLEIRDLVARSGSRIDWDWIAAKQREHGPFRLAVELQNRMSNAVLGADLFHDVGYSTAGYWLHQRRIAKVRFEAAGRVEWSLVRRLLGMARTSAA
jgi:hypothetical protein